MDPYLKMLLSEARRFLPADQGDLKQRISEVTGDPSFVGESSAPKGICEVCGRPERPGPSSRYRTPEYCCRGGPTGEFDAECWRLGYLRLSKKLGQTEALLAQSSMAEDMAMLERRGPVAYAEMAKRAKAVEQALVVARADIAALLPMAERAHRKEPCFTIGSPDYGLENGLRVAREGALLMRLHDEEENRTEAIAPSKPVVPEGG